MNKKFFDISLIGDIAVPPNPIEINCSLSSIVLANLEAPILDPSKFKKRIKAGPSLSSNPIPDIFRNRSVFSLANNHMMDFGMAGLQETLNQCRQSNIRALGAGKDLDEAGRPLILEQQGVKVGILAFCETQFGVATKNSPGVCALNPLIYQSIRKLKEQVNAVIVSVHGASEMCPWPSPQWQELLRSFVDAGVAVVHGHHTHVPQGYEEYNKGLIFYGLGNFLVDPKIWQSRPHTLNSLIAHVSLSSDGIENFQVKLVEIRDRDKKVVVAEKAQSDQDKKYLDGVMRPLKEPQLLQGLWQEFAVQMYERVYAPWLGFEKESLKNILKNRTDKFLMDLESVSAGVGQHRVKTKRLLWYHLFACESHQVCISTALGVLGGELEDHRSSETKKIVNEMAPWLKGQ